MKRMGLSTVAALLSLCAAAVLSGCADTPKDITQQWSPERIQQEASDEKSAGAWDKAIGLYEKLEGRAAGTVLAQQAQLDKAHAQYKTGEKAQAIATLERFMRLHPASPAIDYAMYLKGVVNFNDNLGLFSALVSQDLSERDQKAAKESYAAFADLVARFPNSKYSPDARQRMAFIVQSLAAYEVHVARYYARRGAHVAAIGRAQTALTDYPDVPATEEALAILVHSYGALGMEPLKADALRVLTVNFPKSVYLSRPAVASAPKRWWQLW